MKSYIYIIIVLLLPLLTNAQPAYKTDSKRAIKYYESGRRNYGLLYYDIAEQYLKDAIKADKKFQNAYLILAEVYWDQHKYEDAIKYYEKGLAIDSGFYPRGYINKAKLEIKTYRYSDALESYLVFLKLAPENSKYLDEAKRGIKQARFGIYAMENPVDFKPVNLGPNINSPFHEYWPALSADEQTLVITRRVSYYDVMIENSEQEDFFFSKFEEGQWSQMKNAGPPLNTSKNEGAQSISADGSLMVFTKCRQKGVIGRCDIFYSERSGDEWSKPKNIGEPVNSAYRETQPSLSADGRTLYFASNRPGGKGKMDIWLSIRNEDGSWASPKNLGDSINTSGNEKSPFIHHDNRTLYFSSDTHIGMGDLDLFITRKDDNGIFTEVQNLGYPINTPNDEFGLIVNAKGNMAYYASGMNEKNGKDIYQFPLYEKARPQEVSYLKGKVFDEESRKRLRAKFELYNLMNGQLISRSFSDERTGEFLLCIPTNQNYMLNVEKRGYLFYSDNFALKGIYHLEKPFLKDIPLDAVKIGKSIVLRNIFYETDSYSLRDESKYELTKIVRFLKNNPSIRIEIGGHTDNKGTEFYNNSLSKNRAKTVVDFLSQNGIEIERLTYKGYAYSTPIDSNNTEEGRANNRRTELKIIQL